MAAFTDQFTRRDPLTFTAFGVFDLWPRQIAWEARDLLKGRSKSQLKRIATSVEALIKVQLEHLVSNQGRKGNPHFDANPKAIGYGMNFVVQSSEQLRLQHSDVNLYVAAQSLPKAKQIQFEQWEGLAVLSLWKLIDFFDGITAPRKDLGMEHWSTQPTLERRYEAFRSATPDLIEAMRACTLAIECKTREQQLAAMADDSHRALAEALYLQEAKRREEVSQKARASVSVRHQKTYVHAEEAVRMANAGSFPSLEAAGRDIADRIEKSPGELYSVRVVKQWIKESGWKATRKPKKK